MVAYRKNIDIDLQNFLSEEAIFFGLTGKILNSLPQKEFLQSLIEENLFDEVPFTSKQADFLTGCEHLENWGNVNFPLLSDDVYQKILVDNTNLFVGVIQVLAPPWESVYFNKERMVFQQETLQVREWYRKYGLQSEKLYHEPDDHIGLELSFLAHLAQMTLQALDKHKDYEVVHLLQDQQVFITEHPLRWSQTWCDLVNQHAQTDFYRGIALIVNGALKETADMFVRIFPQETNEGDNA